MKRRLKTRTQRISKQCHLCNEGLHAWWIVLALRVEAILPVDLVIIVCHLAMAESTVHLRSHLSHCFNP